MTDDVNNTVHVFIGVDPRQPVAVTAAMWSCLAHATVPVAIHPLVLSSLPEGTPRGLTEFTFSRLLVPWLMNFQGKAIFIDADVIFKCCPSELIGNATGDHAVWVVPHVDGLEYERASVMVFDNSRCTNLTPDFVRDVRGLGFEWADGNVGYLPADYNHLVWYNEPNPDAKVIHFTQGIPYWSETSDSEHADEWNRLAQGSVSAAPWAEILGPSKHAQYVLPRYKARDPEGFARRYKEVQKQDG